MNRKIEQLIPSTIDAIKDCIAGGGNTVPKVYKGYISSMGASIIQAGLMSTLAFYNNDDGKEGNSSDVLKAIYKVLRGNKPAEGSALIIHVINNCGGNTHGRGTVRVGSLDEDGLEHFKDEISDILVAMKLALRTFKIQ